MTRLYAKSAALLQVFLSVAIVLFLTACAGGIDDGMWDGYNTGVVSNNPEEIPNIRWQTPADVAKEGEVSVIGKAEVTPVDQQKIEPPATALSGKKVKVHILLPLSGGQAALGKSMLNAAQMALFDVSSKNVELVPLDTKSSKQGSAAAAKRALAENSDLILGPVFADDVEAIKPVISGSKTPVVSFTNNWKLAGGNVYVMGFLPFTQVARVARYAQSKNFNRFAVFAPKTEYCDVVITTLDRTVKDAKAEVVETDRYNPSQRDISGLIKDFVDRNKVAGAEQTMKFDVLMLPMGGESLLNVVEQMEMVGLGDKSVHFIGTGLWDDIKLASYPLLHGGWFAAPDPDLRRDFEARYNENFGAAPMRLASIAYDATALAAVLANRAQGDEVFSAEALTNPRGFAGIDGVFRFRKDGLNERGLAVLELQSGGFKVVDKAPTAFALNGDK